MKISNPLNNPQCSFNPQYILKNKNLVSIFLNDKVLDLVEGYLGAPGRLFDINTMCTFPTINEGNAQQLHRDNY